MAKRRVKRLPGLQPEVRVCLRLLTAWKDPPVPPSTPSVSGPGACPMPSSALIELFLNPSCCGRKVVAAFERKSFNTCKVGPYICVHSLTQASCAHPTNPRLPNPNPNLFTHGA